MDSNPGFAVAVCDLRQVTEQHTLLAAAQQAAIPAFVAGRRASQ